MGVLIQHYRNTITPREGPDEWVFETVKATTVATKSNAIKRGKLLEMSSNTQNGIAGAEEALRRLDLKDSPLQISPPPSTVKRNTVRRQISVTQAISPSSKVISHRRQLQPEMAFGNSGSTIRLFRRVSDNTTIGVVSTQDSSITKHEGNHSQTVESVTREGLIARRAYNKVIDSAFQEVHAQTGNQPQREALSHLADAWNALDAVDPEGEYQLLKLIIERVQHDPKLSILIATPQDGMPIGTPQKQKLVMAQNNPHLKSHRRRQSAQVTEDLWKEKMSNMPGQVVPGMEHTKQLADVLYSRWSDGLRSRWPAV
jgi:serine/threonine-protein kinase 24/25/MST4